MTARVRVAAAVLALAGAGWETRVRDPEPEHVYINAYEGDAEVGMSGLWREGDRYDLPAFTNNEHRELAAIALLRLGWGSLLTENPPTMLDLNASLWRPRARQVLTGASTPGEQIGTPLVERAWPGITRFAGLPDYAYGFHDWINASTLCPALPEDAAEYGTSCYVYAAWHGAALNSSHFGEQATLMYRHYHDIALAIAGEAKVLGDAAALAADRDEMLEFVKAAEREALAFEAVAQHYLQDRWSMGHAWNRWNGPRYTDQVRFGTQGLFDSVSTGLISGFVHGAEAALKKIPAAGSILSADPMCSPKFVRDGIEVLAVEHDGDLMPMIGDDRLRDALDGGFGREYGVGPMAPDYPLDVSQQMTDLMRCSMAGWGDVARRFRLENGRSAGLDLAVTDATPTFGDDPDVTAASGGGVTAPCWDMWATNDAMRIGIETLGQGRLAELGVKTLVTGVRIVHPRFHVGPVRLDWKEMWRVTKDVREIAKLNPGGTDLARGETLPLLHGARHGGAYTGSVPMDYSDPLAVPGSGDATPFSSLPLHAERSTPSVDDRPGRDLHALHGFFHQAHMRSWCQRGVDTLMYDQNRAFEAPLQGVRWPVPIPGGAAGPPGEVAAMLDRRLDACMILADRHFQGTGRGSPATTSYGGDQAEVRRVGHGDDGDAASRAPCSLVGEERTWDDGPTFPHPGYVDLEQGPYATMQHYGETLYQSTRAWCQALPVIHVDDDDFAVDDDGERIRVEPGYTEDGRLSFANDVVNPVVTIHGSNFGNTPGRLKLEGEHDCVDPLYVSPYPEIASWTNTRISFRLDQTRFPPDIWTIEVIRDDKDTDLRAIRSVGRFRLDVTRAVYSDVKSAGDPIPVGEGGRDVRSVHPFCDGGDVQLHQIVDCTGLAEPELEACGATAGVGTVKWTGPAAMTDFAAGPYAEHRYSVTQVGQCTDLAFPAACPVASTHGVRRWYGALHRIERTSDAPIGAPPARTWRYVLGWRRYGFGQ